MMDKLANMAMFVRVVELGSFSAAAEASEVSATMVAKHIRMAEERLGARLLHRTTRRQHLTEVGTLYYERCKQVLAEVALAESSASELQATPRGQLRIVAPVSFGSHSLVPVLTEFMALYPEVTVDLTLSNGKPDLIHEGHELGIVIGTVDDPNLVARPLCSYRRVLAASPAYIEHHGQPKHPEELQQHSCLGLSYWRHHDSWHLQGPQGERFKVAVQGRFKANQGDALRIAAIGGVGIVLQPETLLTEDLLVGRLVPVLPDWSYIPSPVSLVYAQDRRPTAKLRHMIDFLIERFGR
ncbi:LysR substrate-binding domain-containing protein [Aquirhabdus sp.]|uniref:LysR substrate-binding domain-containing protein n=1 Tax=Aquirhabdus sp. TaxID=2824160 RepID=UPI00396C2FB1